MAMSSVTLGKACRRSVRERKPLRPAKFIRDREYAAMDETKPTPMTMPTARTNEFRVTRQMAGSLKKLQLLKVHPPMLPAASMGNKPSVR
jgi:hypothetical protein